jgi:cell wall-associated NlpC family hydrolase
LSSFGTLRNRKPSQFNRKPAQLNRKPSQLTRAIAGSAVAAAARRIPRVILTRATLAALAAALIVLALASLAPAPASASTTPRRLTALRWAEHQAGKWYCFGGTGPSCFDCSGLVTKAYGHAGIWLPRTTYGMLASSRLHRIPASQRRRGDLAFYGSGHVELVTFRGTFGALGAGTRVGWHHSSAWWHPTMYFRVR